MQTPAKRIFVLLLLLCGFTAVKAQCPSGNLAQHFTIPCGTSCINLSFTITDLRQSSDYKPLDWVYNPYLYEDRAAPAVTFASPPAWPGNSFSNVYTLPFPFCFYDSVFTKMVIGSNGCISFDTTNALKWCEPRLYVNTSLRNLPSGFFARALIAGVMQDLDPFDTARVVTGEKVEYRIEGVAPCRRAVISYSKIPLWPGTQGNCQSSINTYQIVLHEGTGIIDVFEKDKPSCSGSNNGNAIIGVQNWNRDKGTGPRQRNAGVWGGTNINEAYRLLPFGGSSRFVSATLYENGFRPVATTTVTTTTIPDTVGKMVVNFPNVCPNGSVAFYVMRTTYSSCTGTANVEVDDTVYLTRSTELTNIGYNVVHAACGSANGSITVHVPPTSGNPPYQYSINGGPLQPDSVFTGLGSGNYTIHTQDGIGCSKDTVINLRNLSLLTLNVVVDTPSCNLANDGQITVQVLNGNAPFSYSMNSGPVQATNIFTGLSGNGIYNFDVVDATGCSGNTAVMMPVGPPLQATVQTTATSCAGINNGTITVTPIHGKPAYQYSINGGPLQASNIFTGLSAGNYTIRVIDVSGCQANNIDAVVAQGQPLNVSAIAVNAKCSGGNDGRITAGSSNGVAPFQYSLDNINFQSSPVFNGLTAGSYTVYVKDNNSCDGSTTVTVGEPTPLFLSLTATNVSCNGLSNGTITGIGSGGVSPYTYSLDNINFQTSGNFTGLAAGNYDIYLKDVNGCIRHGIEIISAPAPVIISNISTADASCGGGNDGKIIVTVTGGNGNYQYSTDNITFQTSNTLNVAPGIYSVYIKDAKGCTATATNITVGLSNTLAVRAITDSTICFGKTIDLNAQSNASQYSWSPATGLSNTNTGNPTASFTAPGFYTYYVDAVLGPCVGKDTVNITVLPAPVADAGNNQNICFGDSALLNGSGGTKYIWTPATNISNDGIANPYVYPRQTATYNLQVTDANGCTSLSTDAVTITVIPPPVIHITPDTYVSPGDQIQLHVEGGTSYTWTPPSGLNNPSVAEPVATISSDITYTVVVRTPDGCESSDSVSIKAFKGPDIYVPTAFTPNNDGKNDRFIPIAVGIKSLQFFNVYNRWGQMVFSTKTLRDGWDGKLGGLDQDTGVYVWMVKGTNTDGKIIFKRGTVTLIR